MKKVFAVLVLTALLLTSGCRSQKDLHTSSDNSSSLPAAEKAKAVQIYRLRKKRQAFLPKLRTLRAATTAYARQVLRRKSPVRTTITQAIHAFPARRTGTSSMFVRTAATVTVKLFRHSIPIQSIYATTAARSTRKPINFGLSMLGLQNTVPRTAKAI